MTASEHHHARQDRRNLIVGVVGFILVLLLILRGCGGSDEQPPGASGGGSESATATTTAERSVVSEMRDDMAKAAEERRWSDAWAIAKSLDDEREADYARRAALELLERARSYERRARYSAALRLARRARTQYGRDAAVGSSALIARIRPAATAERADARAAKQAQADRREAATAARKAKREAEAAPETNDYEPPAVETPAPSSSGPRSGGRPGCNPVTARDGDNDGVVCE